MLSVSEQELELYSSSSQLQALHHGTREAIILPLLWVSELSASKIVLTPLMFHNDKSGLSSGQPVH